MAWQTGLATAWNMMMSGDIYGAVMLSYTNVMGAWFYSSLMLLAMIMIYLRTQNFGTAIITGMVVNGAALTLMPAESLFFISITIILGITLIFYKLFHK